MEFDSNVVVAMRSSSPCALLGLPPKAFAFDLLRARPIPRSWLQIFLNVLRMPLAVSGSRIAIRIEKLVMVVDDGKS